MIRTVFSLALLSLACTALAENGTPTLADTTTSVLVNQDQTNSATTTSAPAASPCAETAKEVKLAPWQARRLARQAERQEARELRDCCKCDCCKKKDCRPTALVLTKTAPKCACGCK